MTVVAHNQFTGVPTAPKPKGKKAPTFAEVHKAYLAKLAAHNAACTALGVVEKVQFAFREDGARPMAPLPACLTVLTPPATYVRNGVTIDITPEPYTYASEGEIRASKYLTAEQKTEMLIALSAWKAEQDVIDETSGYAENQHAVAAAEAANTAAGDLSWRARRRLLGFPTSVPEELAIKMAIIKESQDSEGAEIILKALVAAQSQGTPPARDGGPSEFMLARTAMEAAAAAIETFEAREAAAEAAVELEAPTPDCLRRSDPGTSYWKIEQFAVDDSLPFAVRARMLVAFEDWKPRLDAARARYDLEPLGEHGLHEGAMQTLFDALDDAKIRFLEQTPPDLAGLLEQMRVAMDLNEMEWIGDHPDNEDTISRLLSGHVGQQVTALLYRSALRLAGHESPALRASRFDPEAWVTRFEQVAGAEIDGSGVVWREDVQGRLPDAAPGRALWEALSDWQQDEVRSWAEARDIEGRRKAA